jgi:hypothetical protein
MGLLKHLGDVSQSCRVLIALGKLSTMALLGGWVVASCGSSGATFDCGPTYGAACGKSCSDTAPCDVGLHCTSGSCGADCSPIDGCSAEQVCTLSGTCGAATPGVTGTACGMSPHECPTGFVCSTGICKKGCGATQPCPSGSTCSAAGSCDPTNLFSGGDSGPVDEAGFNTDSACVSDRRQGEQIPVDLFFMVDITGSMKCPLGAAGQNCEVDPGPPYDPVNRWTEESKALKAFLASPNNAGQGAGIAFFPAASGDACAAASYATPAVPIAPLPGAATALNAAIDMVMPAGNTPTVASITGALQYAASWATAHPDRKVAVVYSTDGYPKGCNGNTIDAAATVAQMALAGTPSIPTYVLGVGPNLMSLNQIAAAGGTTQAYLVDTGQDVATQLAMALGSIRSRALTCDYAIPAPSMGALDYNFVNVQTTVGTAGMPTLIKRVANAGACDGTMGGWYYDDPNAPKVITLCPSTCMPLLSTVGSNLQVLIGCLDNGGGVK